MPKLPANLPVELPDHAIYTLYEEAYKPASLAWTTKAIQEPAGLTRAPKAIQPIQLDGLVRMYLGVLGKKASYKPASLTWAP